MSKFLFIRDIWPPFVGLVLCGFFFTILPRLFVGGEEAGWHEGGWIEFFWCFWIISFFSTLNLACMVSIILVRFGQRISTLRNLLLFVALVLTAWVFLTIVFMTLHNFGYSGNVPPPENPSSASDSLSAVLMLSGIPFACAMVIWIPIHVIFSIFLRGKLPQAFVQFSHIILTMTAFTVGYLLRSGGFQILPHHGL